MVFYKIDLQYNIEHYSTSYLFEYFICIHHTVLLLQLHRQSPSLFELIKTRVRWVAPLKNRRKLGISSVLPTFDATRPWVMSSPSHDQTRCWFTNLPSKGPGDEVDTSSFIIGSLEDCRTRIVSSHKRILKKPVNHWSNSTTHFQALVVPADVETDIQARGWDGVDF
jgi:hypothetical protein